MAVGLVPYCTLQLHAAHCPPNIPLAYLQRISGIKNNAKPAPQAAQAAKPNAGYAQAKYKQVSFALKTK